MATFEEELDAHGQIIFTNKGRSMLPLLRENRDITVIDQIDDRPLKKHDTVLFKRSDGTYVLHRIISCLENDEYIIAGDNCTYTEKVSRIRIIGRLSMVIRGGKKISVDDPAYRAYVFLWCAPWRLRRSVLLFVSFLRRVINRIVLIFR